jgi:hypothetical protein
MANMNKAFTDFDEEIKLTQEKKDKVLTSRDAVREKIRKHFSDTLKINQPKFKVQGSFTINTALNPIGDNEVDADDGVYLQHFSDDETTWPKPQDAHQLVIDALEGHTQDGCESKTSCVRVLYHNFYHLDMPVYIMKDNCAYLAQTKLNEWQHSDSKDFRDWFYLNRSDEQASRIVRYLKAWRDYRKLGFSSIELTILAVKNFSLQEGRDDLSLLYTLNNINIAIQSRIIRKPVAPNENLWEELSDTEKDRRITQLQRLYDDLQSATNNTSGHRASITLREQFGERYPLLEDETISPIPSYTQGAKPWGF